MGALEPPDLDATATSIVRQYGPRIFQFLAVLLHDEEAAREAFSQFTEDLWRGLPSFRRACSVEAWSYKLARHAALRQLRDPFRRRGRRLATEELDRIADTVARSSLLRSEEQRRRLDELREMLEPDDRALILLRVERGLSWREVAQVLSADGEDPLDEAALRKRFERVKKRLQEKARERGLLKRG